ncbi:MFS general substrate transporter [Heliocybe sulcata]|uniref:MFS general substrate transporter n=1 Tax=Heliocybe sulcata TaxID=5364 RepID=A0A5C3NC81_9AGAM|nr:MFS general substrate transporter [Heliocybe sulcata]
MSPSPRTSSNSHATLSDVSTQLSRIERLRAKFKPIIIAIFAGSMTLDIFNVTGLVFAQSSITEQFGISEAEASWTLSAYSLTFGSFLLLAGRAGDIFGHKQIYTVGLLFFSLFAALTAGITSSLIALIILRAFQGIAAAATIPTAYALVATSFQGKALEMAVAGLGACQCIGVIAGVVRGAFAGTSIGYRGLLWLSFGLGVLFGFLGFLLIPPTPSRLKDMQSLDYGGAVIATSGASLLVLGFTEAQAGWNRATVIAPIAVGGVVFVLFGLYEEVVLQRWMKGVEPLIPRRVWSYKNLVPILGVTSCYYGAFFILILNGSQFYVNVQHRSTIISAVQFLPIAAGAFLLMPIVGHFYNHRFMPPKWVIAFGQCLCLAGVALFSQNQVDSSYWHWGFAGLVLFPFGACTFFVNFLNIAYASAPPEEQGLISGIVQMAAQVATALASGIASSFISGGTREQLLEQYRRSFYLAVALAGLAVVIAAVFIRPIPPKPKKSTDEERVSNEIQRGRRRAADTVE